MLPKSSHLNASAATPAWIGMALVLSACQPHGSSASTAQLAASPAQIQLAFLPLGDIAGTAKLQQRDEILDPFEGDASAIAQGHQLFIEMNCAGCHGYDAKGNIGPNLTDKFWRYGGTPSSIYKSIYEGRPQGMPAWAHALPAQDIWKIVAFLDSLGGAVAANQYHAGLQGDHDVTWVAPEAQSLLGVFDRPAATTTATEGGETHAPPGPASQKSP